MKYDYFGINMAEIKNIDFDKISKRTLRHFQYRCNTKHLTHNYVMTFNYVLMIIKLDSQRIEGADKIGLTTNVDGIW